ncbi:hypothetical protein [Zoogloea sp. 1C4]|uniref:hypothetical protein n=1 Tax=Zoogloea sp. 1C4 TaxID=2570190 RepID=UPI001291B513|nr:hypothetical protein [Zoogloea sp. 1C4]
MLSRFARHYNMARDNIATCVDQTSVEAADGALLAHTWLNNEPIGEALVNALLQTARFFS